MPAKKKKKTKHSKREMNEIMAELQKKLDEIDKLRKKLHEERFSKITASQSKAMLEEIKVPSLEPISTEKKKAKAS